MTPPVVGSVRMMGKPLANAIGPVASASGKFAPDATMAVGRPPAVPTWADPWLVATAAEVS